MSYETTEISSLNQFIDELNKDYIEYSGSVWYRGQSTESYKLLPSYTRDKDTKCFAPETTLLSAFKQNAIMLTDEKPNNSFDWMFLMQHYGIPTRLLDWSESPLIALYFALENIKSDTNAVVWSLKPTELNTEARIISDEEYYIPSFDDSVIKDSYSIEVLSNGPATTKLSPVATIATRNNIRIQAQLGAFTIHHREDIAIEEVGNGSHVKKYIIKDENKEEIFKQLSLLGIGKFQIFPELSSIKSVMEGRNLI